MIIARAPLRISFCGGGTDLPAYYSRFGGLVVSAAISRYCYVVAHEQPGSAITINSADYHDWVEFPSSSAVSVEPPLALPRVVLSWFIEQGLLRGGINLFLAAEVPPGSGLGSSSAMTVALVTALNAYTGHMMPAVEVAELACHLEIERLGTPIGKQDQYASACGGLNTLTFTADGVKVSPLKLSAATIEALNERLLLFTTGQTRSSADILGPQQANMQKQAQKDTPLHRMKGLAMEIRQALQEEDLDRFAYLLDVGWQEKKRLSQHISSQAIDQWYATARAAGARGGKITGAGGGGFMLLYCPPERQPTLRAALAQPGLRELSFQLDWQGSQIIEGTLEYSLLPNDLIATRNRR
jgi:D-glycero-alpha-D-manno-heptose-7-phosphate kinase